jgi:hypothetical protein
LKSARHTSAIKKWRIPFNTPQIISLLFNLNPN